MTIYEVDAPAAAERPSATSRPQDDASPAPMRIGVYVRLLENASPAATRFQESILEGLRPLRTPQFQFVVLSETIPASCKDDEHISYVRLAQPTARSSRGRPTKLLAGALARRGLRMVGRGSGPSARAISEWLRYEPPHYQQLRDLNIRFIWNLGIDVLDSFLPFSMVVWDSNHRIHTMLPEFSRARDGSALRDLYSEVFDRFAPLMPRASYLIVGTEQGKREVIDAFGIYPSKIKVIPFATPTLPPPAGTQPQRPPYLFYPGRFWPHKNQIVLVHALQVLRDRWGLAPHCVFSGFDNGNLGYVLRTAEQLGVRDQIEYLGNVTLEELADLYRGAAALVYCSAMGPDNFPPLEAMSVGCPVIAADVPGATEQLGDAALLFNWTDEAQLGSYIKRILEDSSSRAALIDKGYARAARWTPRHYADAMLAVLQEFARYARLWENGEYHLK